MTPQKLSLTPFTEGDTWDGIPSLTVTINGSPPASALSLVTMRFKKSGGLESETVQLTSATVGQITITNAATWAITVPAQIVPALTAAGRPVSFVELSSPYGHDAFLLDSPEMNRVVAGFLEGGA